MPRLYLTAFFCVSIVFVGVSQSKLSSYLKHAEEKYNKGDYIYALELYEKALEIDSNSVKILWDYAETLKAYKDYRKAAYYYAKVYDKEEGGIYPMSLLNLGLMQKQNGDYDAALETFKKAKKKFNKDKKSYIYIKSKREIESCLWAKSASKDTLNLIFEQLPETVNTKNAEFGHLIFNNQLIFSSLRADSISQNEEVYGRNYTTQLYQSAIDSIGFKEGEKIKDLIRNKYSNGNGTFSLDGNRFYFSSCKDDGYNYTCKIMVANYTNGKWSAIDSLGDIINEPGTNTTMPSIGELDGKEVLFFSSDRKGGEGGMDIWYSFIKNGNQFDKVRNLKAVNSPDNELTPWWDNKEKKLYFSSSWQDGFGGYDIFQSPYKGQFEIPENLGLPINSPANDLYYFKSGDTSYFSSNRIGVLYSKNPTCCSDIFRTYPPIKIEEPTPRETLADLNKRLPVTLYFHNDCPDPKSRDTTTKVNYINGYYEYRAMLEKYQQEYSQGLSKEKAEEAKEDIESFFIEFVDQGVKDLQLFQALLLEELQKGAKINLTVKGFASPLAKTDYNVNLTKRRIGSLINYLMQYDNGVFKSYITNTAENSGRLTFSQVPFGEYTANKLTSDNFHDQKNSVYSRAAAIERKIEIQSVNYLEELELASIVSLHPNYIDLKAIKQNEKWSRSIELINNSSSDLTVESIRIPNDLLKIEINNFIPSLSKIKITVEQKVDLPKGLFSIPILIYFKGYEQPLEFRVNGEGF